MFCDESELEMQDSQEWTYSMRQDKQMITKGVYLGPYSAASKSKLQDLIACGITHIICVRHPMEGKIIRPNFPENFEYLVVEVADNPCENILSHFSTVIQFMNLCVSKGGSVLVHGNAGISRSAAFVVAFLMQKQSISFKEAYAYVKSKRFCVNVNLGFIRQLKEFEPIYKAQMGSNDTNLIANHYKRNASDADLPLNYMDNT